MSHALATHDTHRRGSTHGTVIALTTPMITANKTGSTQRLIPEELDSDDLVAEDSSLEGLGGAGLPLQTASRGATQASNILPSPIDEPLPAMVAPVATPLRDGQREHPAATVERGGNRWWPAALLIALVAGIAAIGALSRDGYRRVRGPVDDVAPGAAINGKAAPSDPARSP